MKNIIYLLFILIISRQILSAESGIGAGAFMQRGNSASQIAIGNSGLAVVSDPSALYYNPAGLANAAGFMLQSTYFADFGYSNSISDMSYQQISLSYSPHKAIIPGKNIYMGMGIAVMGYSVKDIDYYDDNSNYLSTENFYEHAIMGAVSFKWFYLKLGLKYLFMEQNFGSYIQNSDFDDSFSISSVGVQYQPYSFISVGFVLQDSIKIGVYDQINRLSSVGISLIISDFAWFDRILLHNDLHVDKYQISSINSGIEFKKGMISFKTGINDIPLNIGDFNLPEIGKFNTKYNMGLGFSVNKYIKTDIAYQQSFDRGFSFSATNRLLAITITLKKLSYFK